MLKRSDSASQMPGPQQLRQPTLASSPSEATGNLWSTAGLLWSARTQGPPLVRSDGGGPVPLSFAQERLWQLEKAEPGSPSYHVSLAWQIDGALDVPALEKTLVWLSRRHETLRASFPDSPTGPCQRINDTPLKLTLTDLRQEAGASLLEDVHSRASQFIRHPFDLAAGPLARAALYRHGPQNWLLVLAVHQMLFDGTSMRILSRELSDGYRAFASGTQPPEPPLPIRYSDFARWQREYLQGQLLDQALEHWHDQLLKSYAPLNLPVDHPRQNGRIPPTRQLELDLPTDLIRSLKQLAHHELVTPFTALMASFQAYLGRESQQEDVIIMVSVSGRSRPELRDLVGLVANIVPMRLDLSDAPSFRQVLRRAGAVVSMALPHQMLPLGRILELLPAQRSATDASVLQVLMMHNAAPLPVLQFPSLTFTPILNLDHGTTNFELALDVSESSRGVEGYLKYRADLFDSPTVERMLRNWRQFIQEAVADPDLRTSPRNGSILLAGLTTPQVRSPELCAPPTETCLGLERALIRIWEDGLGRCPIGRQENFFALGGHSLVALKLLQRMEQELGIPIHLSQLFENPTIARLAQAIHHRQEQAKSSLVEIQPKGARPRLFLVHGVGGGMFWGYSNLARHLGPEQPIYAFQSRGLSGLKEYETIEEMAAHYVADLRAFQPRGPYYLGGYCFGGNVAYEMARQLVEQHQHVALLLLINCWPNNSSYAHLRWTPAFLAKVLWNFCLRLGHQIRWGARRPQDFFRWRTRWAWKRLKRLFISTQASESVEDFVDLSSYSAQEQKLWKTHVQAWMQYQPKPFPGRIVLFRTRGHPLVCSFDHQMGWGAFAQGGVTVQICPGDHESILEEENVGRTAQHLAKVLKQTQTDSL